MCSPTESKFPYHEIVSPFQGLQRQNLIVSATTSRRLNESAIHFMAEESEAVPELFKGN